MTQREIRIDIINLLYRHFVLNNSISQTKQESFDFSQSVRTEEEINKVIQILDHLEQIIADINQNLKPGWVFERLSNYHKAVLVYSVYEIKELHTSRAIVINEALEIVKKYGEDEDYSYLNKVLDQV
ncbi:hypothetical protein P344_03095 [Spiroplasma mirum ATCC 29335]|uniref:NusB/RsmB/TIM44 domain-containing protein n=1 Tax=Spiroplasma mirum ATCC 29335 TaxID=838561 RepID=W0GPE5_9MOLU|nr:MULTISPECIES: transcription antitermination factor NusB [Spiroplasma]AHF60953.1 transcription antitermination protein [Spiroplasma mirum ATCC 29335]AHI57963.1 hypothetical protein P344_03095 [Spiroplasma mirum ATCC 29335]AKM53057.1 transcription antitermination protein NusB [Spiroplasma atrichopogonis]